MIYCYNNEILKQEAHLRCGKCGAVVACPFISPKVCIFGGFKLFSTNIFNL
jgi:hypothetical protein